MIKRTRKLVCLTLTSLFCLSAQAMPPHQEQNNANTLQQYFDKKPNFFVEKQFHAYQLNKMFDQHVRDDLSNFYAYVDEIKALLETKELKKKKPLSIKKRLKVVDKFVRSTIKYAEDKQGDLLLEDFSSPSQTLAKGFGDCEDTAILKYFILKELGFKDSQMRLIFYKYGHVNLAVNVDKKLYFLDIKAIDLKEQMVFGRTAMNAIHGLISLGTRGYNYIVNKAPIKCKIINADKQKRTIDTICDSSDKRVAMLSP